MLLEKTIRNCNAGLMDCALDTCAGLPRTLTAGRFKEHQ